VKTASKIIFASALALSIAAPAFAYETDLEYQNQVSTTRTHVQHVMGNPARAYRTGDALNANAYAPSSAPIGVDFGIGSQR
jgi:hypothetical protein